MSSLAARAFVALSLMVGFYLLALGLAGALIAIPLLEWFQAGRIHMAGWHSRPFSERV